jgi:hypothetical protein
MGQCTYRLSSYIFDARGVVLRGGVGFTRPASYLDIGDEFFLALQLCPELRAYSLVARNLGLSQ